MGTTTIPFNDPNGLKEIEKIINDPILGKNIRTPFRVPLPQDKNGLHQISEIVEGFYLDDAYGIYGTNTEVTFKIGNRVVYQTPNTTVLGGRMSLLENAFGITPNINQHLTLNTIMGIPHAQTNNVIVNKVERKADYFMAGDGASSVAVPGKVYSPKNYETKLYHALPFRLVPIASDINANEKQLYRMRKIEVINGNEYIAYYAKKYDPGVLYLEYNDTDYLPTESDTVPVDENDAGHPLLGGSILCYIQFTLAIEANELKEYFQVVNGSIDMASMSEAGIVLSADLPNSLNDNDEKELAGAELFSKVSSKPYYLDSEGTARTIIYKIYSK
jgi:hypothetical protein